MKLFEVSTLTSISVGKVAGRKTPAIMVTKIGLPTITVGYCSSEEDAEILCEVLELLSKGMASYRQQLDMIQRIVEHGHLTFEDIL